jgi:SAM-dependent methyltransferase
MSVADPRLSVPVRLSPDQCRALARRRGSTWDVFARQLSANIRRVDELRRYAGASPLSFKVVGEDARALGVSGESGVASNSVDLVLTSPPYAGAQKYVRAVSLSLGWLGLAGSGELKPIENQTIGREHLAVGVVRGQKETSCARANRVIKKIDAVNPTRAAICATYLNEMEQAIAEMSRVLVPGGYLVMVIGNNEVCGFAFESSKYMVDLAARHNLSVRLRLIDEIKSRGLMTKRNRSASIITREWVLVFQKHCHG